MNIERDEGERRRALCRREGKLYDFVVNHYGQYANTQTEDSHMSAFIFKGTIQKMQLISNNLCFGSSPKPEDEIEQHLTITADGDVWLSRYRDRVTNNKHELIEKINFNISSEAVEKILGAVTDYFGNEFLLEAESDVGLWQLLLTDTEGKDYNMTGPLSHDLYIASGGLSDVIRTNLNMDDLFAFDGNPDRLMKVEIKYHRNTKIKPRIIPKDAAEEYVTWDYNEFLTIDRTSETLEHVREIGPGCKVTNSYYLQEAIASLLDNISIYVFPRIEGNPPDVVDDPLEMKEYTITLYTKCGVVREMTGTFDKKGLPEDWSEFIDKVYEFMAFYGLGELFDKRFYGTAKRRKRDYIFCNVMFENGGRTYCYLADSDDYRVGDLVVVPAGPDNHEVVVSIESIEYYSKRKAPFPVKKAKHILRKFEKVDDVEG